VEQVGVIIREYVGGVVGPTGFYQLAGMPTARSVQREPEPRRVILKSPRPTGPSLNTEKTTPMLWKRPCAGALSTTGGMEAKRSPGHSRQSIWSGEKKYMKEMTSPARNVGRLGET